MPRLREFAAPLSERPFRMVFLARAASIIGDEIAPIAVAFAILDLTGSVTDLGLALAARTATFVVFVLAGGVWADRLPRAQLMVGSDVGRLVSQGLLGTLVVVGTAQVPVIVAVLAFNGAATAFFRPAAQGLTPETVSPDNLQRANSLLVFTESAAQIVGPAIAGGLILATGPGWGLLADAATFGASALFLSRLRLPDRIRAAAGSSFVRDLREGWGEVRSRTWLWMMILLCAAFQVLVLATFMVLGPAAANRALGGAGAWSLISAGMGVGAVLGTVAAMWLRPRRPLVASNLVLVLMALPMVLLTLDVPALVVAVAGIGGGFGMSLFAVLYETTLQRNVPGAALSRVASYDWLGSTALRPLGYAAVGPVAAAAGVDPTLAVAAALITALLLGSIAVPSIRGVHGVDQVRSGPDALVAGSAHGEPE